ncbi:MAG: hypothetical protein IJA34_01785, partial [Lachnospiraceae bacterium]|nr:hypothetical protein [Lachnospiraceae bacterium]
GANPVNSAAPILNNIYNNIFELYYNMLNGETALKDYLAMTYVKESESGNKYIDTTLFDTYMKICNEKGVDIKNTVKDMGRYILSINYGNKENFVRFVESYIGYQDIIDELSKISGTYFVIGTEGDDSIFIKSLLIYKLIMV